MIDATKWLQETWSVLGPIGILKNYWFYFLLVGLFFFIMLNIIDYIRETGRKDRNFLLKAAGIILVISTYYMAFTTFNDLYDQLVEKTPRQTFVEYIEEVYQIQKVESKEIEFEKYRYMPEDGIYEITYIKDGKKINGELRIDDNKILILDDNNEILKQEEKNGRTT